MQPAKDREYKQDGGQFRFFGNVPSDANDGSTKYQQVYASPSIAFAWTKLPDRIHVFTHGPLDSMLAWQAAHNADIDPHPHLPIGGPQPYIASLKVFDQGTSVDVLNRIFDDPTFFATLLP